MPASDENLLCPHGRLGPWTERECGCQLVEVVHSEVAMHMKVAGHVLWGWPVQHSPRTGEPVGIQLLDFEGHRVGSPITRGESGYQMP